MSTERRFQGAMSEDYKLVRRAVPDFDALQDLVAGTVAGHHPSQTLRVLDLGCGDGVTSRTILARRPDVVVVALDSEAGMVAQANENLAPFIQAGRCQVVLHDALAYLRARPVAALDVVASALALHNQQRDYRHALHAAILRALKPGGLFVNVDKYPQDEAQRSQWLQLVVNRFFDLLVPLGKLDLLRECVLHEIADDAPERLLRERDAVEELAALGFHPVELRDRHYTVALLVAGKPVQQEIHHE